MNFGTPIILFILVFTLISCSGPEDNNNTNNVKINDEIIEKENLSEDQANKYETEKNIAQETHEKLEVNFGDSDLPTIATGSFNGITTGHNGSGSVIVKDNGDTVIIELSENFSSDIGPDLYLILTKNQSLEGIDPVKLDTSKILKINPLISNSGRQSYEILKVDFDAHSYGIAVRCSKFNILFAGALLK